MRLPTCTLRVPIFELSWGFPDTGKDYLDATVFLYKEIHFVETVDYDHCESKSGSVTHSGDILLLSRKIGYHRIDVLIKSLHDDIDTLVFTLSSWNSSNISKFRNPSLKFFDKKFPQKQLCSDKMEHAACSQAIVMCSLSKRKDGWRVYGIKTLSDGNAKNYQPLKEKILSLVQKDMR